MAEREDLRGDELTFESVGSILQSLMNKRTGLRKKLKKREIFTRWKDIAGSQLKGKVFPLRIRGNVLFVAAMSASWAQEASFFRDRILDNISREIGDDVVEEIRIEVRGSGNISSEMEIKRPEEQDRQNRLKSTPSIDICGEFDLPAEELDMEDLLKRLRRVDEKMKKWRHKQGWPLCQQCGLAFPPDLRNGESDDICPICRRYSHEENIPDVRRLVSEAPWMSTEELMGETGASFEVCQQIRADMELYLRCRIVECVNEATSGGDLPQDFRRCVMQLIMLVKSKSDPPLNYREVEEQCGATAADLFF